MSETDIRQAKEIFDALSPSIKQKALDSYRTALKKKIEELKINDDEHQFASDAGWNAAIDTVLKEIDSTTI